MRIHDDGVKSAQVMIMLPGSFCNADSMANIISRLETEFRILAVDYSGQYAESEKPFTSRAGEAEEIICYLQTHGISCIALVYGQSMGSEMGMELIAQCRKNGIAVHAAFFDGGPFLRFPKIVSRLLGNKFKTIVGNLRGKTLEEALREPTIVKFSGGKPERYSKMLGPICQNAASMSDETLEREADACVTFDYPAMDEKFQKHMYFFYSKEESAWRFCHRRLKKAYPSVIMLFMEFFGLRVFVKLLSIPKYILLPCIFVLCAIGAYNLKNNMSQVIAAIGFGILGFAFKKFGIPSTPFILGFILGPLAESNYRRGMMRTKGDFTPFLTSPISAIFLAIAALVVILYLLKPLLAKRKAQKAVV